jgi:phage terminase large subunit GpA-like protein
MVTMPDAGAARALRFAPLPPHPRPEDLLADALPIMDVPSRVPVSEAARRYVRVPQQGLWANYDPAVTPYMVEPQDMTTSRIYRVVAVVAPAQSGKTQALQNVLAHRVTCSPMPSMVIHMDKPSRDRWVDQKLNPMLMNSPELWALTGQGRDDSTFSRKRFRGMRAEIGYPTPQQLSSATYGLVLMTDFDHMPQVLGPKDAPEGSPLGLARQRIRTFMSRGCVFVESTPAFPWADATWSPRDAEPHMMPPAEGGIVQVYNDGTRGRWYWACPDCDEMFEPRFDRLVYDDTLSPGEAGARAEMACPHCGSLIAHRHKVELNRAALKGRGGWMHETRDGGIARIGDPAIRQSEIVSYALNGAAAAFASWADLVSRYLAAKTKADTLGDETDLAQVRYTEIGVPHRPARMDRDSIVGVQALKDNAQATPRGVCPAWTRFITVSVDVQATRFPVQVTAWGENGQAQVVDRFDLITPPEGSPHLDGDNQGRALDPARYQADWAVLDDLAGRTWPVADAGYGLRPIGCVVDFQGAPGVSDNAEAFLKRRRKDGCRAWFVSRGHGGLRLRNRVWYERPEGAAKGRKARSIRILNFASDRLKDTVAAQLMRGEGVTAAMFVPDWMTDDQLAEFTAEERTDKGWVKKPGQVRNEGLDLSVQARALAEHKGLTRIDWGAPPDWARGGATNANAVLHGAIEDAAPPPDAAPAVPGIATARSRAPRARPWIETRKDWL